MQYLCDNPRRKQLALAHATLNGIDYLEVLDDDAPTGTPRQRTLFVRCLKTIATPLSGANVRIDGGVRITPVGVTWAAAASDEAALIAAGTTQAERDLFLALTDADRVLVVRTDVAGDFSIYRLRLVDATGETSHPDFDALLASVSFSFKVECPTEFDCKVTSECPPSTTTAPPIDYLSKDYASFRQLMLDRLAIVMPQWRERSAADIEIALVETLAYAADQLSYYQDAVATEAYLGTARRRESVHRHARLLDYPMHDGCNARAWVRFEVSTAGDGILLPGGRWKDDEGIESQPTRLLTTIPGAGPAVEEADVDTLLSRYAAEVYELIHDVTLREAHNQMEFHTWGDEECCLPRGATQATLAGQYEDLAPGDVLILEEIKSPETGREADADPAHRVAVRLVSVSLGEDPLVVDEFDNPAPITDVEWNAQDALPFALCISKAGETLQTDMSVAHGNVALVDHGRTVEGETLTEATGDRSFRPRLRETGMTFGTAYDAEAPASLALAQDPRSALPAIRLADEDDVPWQPQRTLLDSDRFDKDFVVELDNDGRATLRFGDDVYGRIPAEHLVLAATYRVGNGSGGNVGAEAIGHVVTGESGITLVRNPLPAAGGVDPESLAEVRLYAPQAFRTQERAVTTADYAAIAQRHPEVQKAVATRRWTGSWYTMFIAVDRKGGRSVDDLDFQDGMLTLLERYKLAGHDVEIDGPHFVPLDIILTVCVQSGYFRSGVKRALLDAFSSRDLPDGSRGFFHPDRFTFGQPVYLSEVIETAMSVPGVHWVDADDTPPKPNRFQRWGRTSAHEVENGVIEMERLEIARLDNDPNAQENGRIEFVVEGGL